MHSRYSWDEVHQTAIFDVTWSRKGKVWTNEKLLKAHLLKYTIANGLPSDWEVLEVTEIPTKPMNEWVDAKMLVKLLKAK